MTIRIKLFFLYIFLFFLFSVTFFYIVVPNYGYMGFYINFSLENFTFSIILLLFITATLDLKKETFSSLFSAFIVFSVLPMLVLFSFQNFSLKFGFFVFVSLVLIIVLQYISVPFFVIRLNLKLVYYFIFISMFLVLFFLILKNYSYFNLNLFDVYQYRRIISENTPVILAYIYNVIFKGLYPLIYLYLLFYIRNLEVKVLLMLTSMVLYIIVFGLTSHKTFLFLIPALTIFYFIATKIRKWVFFYGKIVLIMLLLVIAIYSVFQELGILISSLLIRRVFFIPALLNFEYFEFFQENPFIYFTNSKYLPFAYIFDYPYDIDLAHLIGREVFGKELMAANTGWIGSGYAHAGLLGIVIYAIIVGMILKYLENLSKYLRRDFIILSFFPYIFVMYLSSDLKTVLITHGLIFYLTLLSLLAYYEKRRRLRLEYKNLPHNNCSSRIRH